MFAIVTGNATEIIESLYIVERIINFVYCDRLLRPQCIFIFIFFVGFVLILSVHKKIKIRTQSNPNGQFLERYNIFWFCTIIIHRWTSGQTLSSLATHHIFLDCISYCSAPTAIVSSAYSPISKSQSRAAPIAYYYNSLKYIIIALTGRQQTRAICTHIICVLCISSYYIVPALTATGKRYASTRVYILYNIRIHNTPYSLINKHTVYV